MNSLILFLILGIFVATLGLVISAAYFLVIAPLWKKQLMARLAALEDISAASEQESGMLRGEKLSHAAFLNNLINDLPGIQQLRQLLLQASVRMEVESFVLIVFGLALLALMGITMLKLPAPAKLLLLVVPPAIPFLVLSHKRRRRLEKFEEMFPDAIDLLARAVRSNIAFTVGLELIGSEMSDPVGEEFRLAYQQQKLGLPLRDALKNLSVRVPLSDVRIFISALQIQRDVGGNLGEILDTLSRVIRQRFTLMRDVKTHTAEGRLTMHLLTAIPLAGGLLIYFLRPGYMTPLFTDPAGQTALTASICLQIFGYFLISRIVRIKV